MFIQIKGEPISRKAHRGAVADSERAWQKIVADQTKGLPKITTPHAATIVFRIKKWHGHGPDIDNLLKPVLDALKLTIFPKPTEDAILYVVNVAKKQTDPGEEPGVDLYFY